MTLAPVVRTRGLVQRYGSFTALDGVDLELGADRIYGLLGRNGAGKTTLMQLLTGQIFPSGGALEVFGHAPAEHAGVLRRLCFIAESQRYPDNFSARHVLKAAPWYFENWDAAFAERLVADFGVPLGRRMKKLSRGQLSAVGVIVGLASRAELTFFDEPYLGLDAVARHIFYDRLLEDYAEHPRTIVLSTHLIDEVANLLEHVVVIDQGRILLDQDADEVRGSATTVAGASAAVDAFVADRPVIARERLGGLASVTIDQRLDRDERVEAAELGLELAPVSLQQLIVHLTGAAIDGSDAEGKAA
ncbi:ABC transporter ATP-binding protein [Microbacterium sp. ASV49]|uniref:ABC transporter ATP-binding protein n=1 Tax=Microbacterium candidum TaxID=3041922 RepID=A0ABT7MVF5_9MICO|nr:ABC transporter ATP-binding protein [Microbacterium sp. ASV49]MDL9978440.1 ABC transporter ATP-binding protein [Microbacterium sp. ASV49]